MLKPGDLLAHLQILEHLDLSSLDAEVVAHYRLPVVGLVGHCGPEETIHQPVAHFYLIIILMNSDAEKVRLWLESQQEQDKGGVFDRQNRIQHWD